MDIVEQLLEENKKTEKINDWLMKENERLRAIVIEHGLWKTAPCCLCGYNGSNYFQPSVHKCAALQQKDMCED